MTNRKLSILIAASLLLAFLLAACGDSTSASIPAATSATGVSSGSGAASNAGATPPGSKTTPGAATAASGSMGGTDQGE